MGLLHLGMLFALGAVTVPVVIHLLRRRRHDVVAWGAMQFLPASIPTRRRRFWDELPLMALRMGIVALIVLALAGPYSTSAFLAPLSDGPPRDVVIVLDGSFSMDRRDAAVQTPWADACRWAEAHVTQVAHGERAALLVARRPPLAWQGDLTADRGVLQSRIENLPAPRGNTGLPQTLVEAWRLLQTESEALEQEIVIVRDRQYVGWADEATRRQWESVSRTLRAEAASRHAAGQSVPRLRIVEVGQDRTGALPNFALGPLAMSRPIVPLGQGIKFTTTLHGASPAHSPRAVRIAVDGESSQELPMPATFDASATVPLSFVQRFDKPGRHVITATLDVGDHADALSVDNEQHSIVEVVAELPVLLVDGDRQPGPESSTFFLEKALAPKGKQSIVTPRVVAHHELTEVQVLGTDNGIRPRVVVLADIPALPTAAVRAIGQYVQDGGSMVIAVGPRARGGIDFYNDTLYRGGDGWLPARLLGVGGESGANGARAAPQSFQHPALDLFRKGLGDVAFPHWWRLAAGAERTGTVTARLDNGDPLLVEKAYGRGRVLLMSIPLDRGWDSPLPGVWEYPVLVHELIYQLAGAQARDWLLGEGQPLRVGPGPRGGGPGRLIVQTPDLASKTVVVRDWPWVYPDTGAIGLYRVERDDGSQRYFVVPPDLRASPDRRCRDEEWSDVLRLLPFDTTAELTVTEPVRRHELWWMALIGVTALLCVEVLLTRRLALSRRLVRPAAY
jgi:hypothetical protein